MNRYKYSKPSLATADTLCQKCLKKGHYSYECTAAQQDRPYVSRPSRTQQLLNPKLAPKITEAVPTAAERSKDEKPEAKASKRKRDEDAPGTLPRKRSRSMSTSSSDSVSSISTNRSPSNSRSPPARRRRESSDDQRRSAKSVDRPSEQNANEGGHRPTIPTTADSREHQWSDNDVNDADESLRRRSRRESNGSRERHARYHNRSKIRSRSPNVSQRSRNPGSRSRSPYRRRDANIGRQKDTSSDSKPGWNRRRERSLSPYSKRVALTQANM